MGGTDELNRAVYEKYRQFIPDAFSDYEWKETYPLELPLPPDSKELHEVIELFRTAGEEVTLFSEARYTKRELKDIQYFQMVDPAPLEMEGTDAAEYGTKYEDYCPRCLFANNRVGNILVDRKFVKNKKYGTLFPDRFVSAETKIIIEANQLTGISFGDPVLDYKGREINPLYSVHFDNVLPPLSKETFLEPYDKCKICGRPTIYLRSDLQYET